MSLRDAVEIRRLSFSRDWRWLSRKFFELNGKILKISESKIFIQRKLETFVRLQTFECFGDNFPPNHETFPLNGTLDIIRTRLFPHFHLVHCDLYCLGQSIHSAVQQSHLNKLSRGFCLAVQLNFNFLSRRLSISHSAISFVHHSLHLSIFAIQLNYNSTFFPY